MEKDQTEITETMRIENDTNDDNKEKDDKDDNKDNDDNDDDDVHPVSYMDLVKERMNRIMEFKEKRKQKTRIISTNFKYFIKN